MEAVPVRRPSALGCSAQTGLYAGLLFGLPMAAFIGLMLGLIMGWPKGLSIGVLLGLLGGALFGLVMGLWTTRVGRRMSVTAGSIEGESVLHHGAGNHFLNGEGRGGWLALTDQSLVWRSHGVNLQNAPLRIALADVRSITPSRILGLLPTGLRVETADGNEEKFVVSGRREWIRVIDAARTPRPTG